MTTEVENLSNVAREIAAKAAGLRTRNEALEDELAEYKHAEKIAGRKRLGSGASSGDRSDAENERAAFIKAVRGNDAEYKSLTSANSADGGYTVPSALASQIITLEQQASPELTLVSRLQISTPDYRVPIETTDVGAQWSAESDTRSATQQPVFASVSPPGGEMNAVLSISNQLLDDNAVNLEAYLVDRISKRFAITLSAAIISGNGVSKPAGISSYATATTADGTRPYGTIQVIHSGLAAALPVDGALYDLTMDLLYSLKPGHRSRASFLMTAPVLAKYRQARDLQGRPLWQPSLAVGQPATLCGLPVFETAHLPAVAAGVVPILLGDFSSAYILADRTPFTLIRDPFTVKGFTIFYCARRCYGAMVNTDAVKGILVGV